MTAFSFFGPFDTVSPDDLRSRLRTLEHLVARAPIPMAIAHDARCEVITANAALARLLGVPPEENISLTPPPGQEPPYHVQHNGADIPTEDLPMQYAVAHRTAVSNYIEILRADGSVAYVRYDVEPLYDANGEVCGAVSVVLDLTERKQVEDVLREADRRKDEFLATLSHELRNPLAPIRHALEVLRRSPDQARREQALAIMERQLQQLVRLTDDLLDLSRITRNRIDLRRQRIDLRAVVQSAAETVQPMADAAGHTLTIALPAAPLWVDGDFARLAQVFSNLLDNAVKYTDRSGRISIEGSASGNHAAIVISDTGIGMAPDEIPRIFDMFHQLNGGGEPGRGGLGIGLTLARQLIELHGGTLEARSEGRGRGSSFTVRLPLDVRAAERAATASAPEAVTPRRVLVAEDIPDAAEMLRMMLELAGHEVRVAADGVQALEVARDFAPHIAFLDIGMPRKDGYEAARELRALLGPRVVLVALTGWGQEDDQRRASDAGFDHHLTKPAEPDRLLELIASAVHD